jgi:hypothetical protein
MVGTAKFEARIKELVENPADLAVLVEPLLGSAGRFASRLASCIAACWLLSEMMKCVDALLRAG